MKRTYPLISLILIATLLAACIPQNPSPADTAVPAATVTQAAATATATVAPTPITPTAAVPTPTSAGAPNIAVDKPVRFAAGPLALEVQGAVVRGQRDRYRLSMGAGETLDVRITALEENAAFTILGPDQKPLPGTEEGQDTVHWSAPVQAEGEYAILVGPTRGNATYTLKVNVTGVP